VVCLKQLSKSLALFAAGGLLYYVLEILWRGYSHMSMFVLGGICFVLIGLINELYTWDMALWKQMMVAALLVTLAELIAGLVLNVWLKMNIWDYSSLPYNLLGQISVQYSIRWFFLSLLAIVLDDFLRWWLFNEEKPRYRII